MEFRILTLLFGADGPLGKRSASSPSQEMEEFDTSTTSASSTGATDATPAKPVSMTLFTPSAALLNEQNNPLYDSFSTPYDPSAYSGSGSHLFSITAICLVIAEGLIYLLLGSLAAWLSWTSNASISWHPLMRVLFSLFAFVFSASYIVGHVLFKLDLLSALRVSKGLSQAVAVAKNVSSSSHLQQSQPHSQPHSQPQSQPQSQQQSKAQASQAPQAHVHVPSPTQVKT